MSDIPGRELISQWLRQKIPEPKHLYLLCSVGKLGQLFNSFFREFIHRIFHRIRHVTISFALRRLVYSDVGKAHFNHNVTQNLQMSFSYLKCHCISYILLNFLDAYISNPCFLIALLSNDISIAKIIFFIYKKNVRYSLENKTKDMEPPKEVLQL